MAVDDFDVKETLDVKEIENQKLGIEEKKLETGKIVSSDSITTPTVIEPRQYP